MNTKNGFLKIVIFVLLFIIGYVVGVYFPIKNILPVISKNSPCLNSYEYYSLLVNAVLALLTLLTVIVALLKEEITGLWRRPKFSCKQIGTNLFKEQLFENSGQTTAEDYNLIFELENTGKIDAKNLRILITKLQYTNKESGNTLTISIKNKKIEISQFDSQILAPKSPIEIIVATISEARNQPVAAGSVSGVNSPLLRIGKNEISKEYHKGEIQIELSILCDGSLPFYKQITLRWDGQWKGRLSDMSPAHINAIID